MSRRLLVLLVVVCCWLSTLLAAQGRTGQAPTPAAPVGENLASLASGAVVVVRPTPPDANGEAWFLLDDDPRTGWTSLSGKHLEPTVIELADRSVIRSVQFDTAMVETDGRLARRMLVEMSDTSAKDGFKPIADVTLSASQKDGQIFKTTADVPGRWLRLSVKSMHAPDHDITQLMGFRAFGVRLTHNPPPTVTGTYETMARSCTSSRRARASPAATRGARRRSRAAWTAASSRSHGNRTSTKGPPSASSATPACSWASGSRTASSRASR